MRARLQLRVSSLLLMAVLILSTLFWVESLGSACAGGASKTCCVGFTASAAWLASANRKASCRCTTRQLPFDNEYSKVFSLARLCRRGFDHAFENEYEILNDRSFHLRPTQWSIRSNQFLNKGFAGTKRSATVLEEISLSSSAQMLSAVLRI
jgi:hypothetical protein